MSKEIGLLYKNESHINSQVELIKKTHLNEEHKHNENGYMLIMRKIYNQVT